MSKEVVFNKFVEKARKRVQERNMPKYKTLYIPSLDENIKIRNLDYQEIIESLEVDAKDDTNKGDRYAVYLSVVEPDLKQVAKELKERGEISEYMDVTDIFEYSEINEIATEIMELSGVAGTKHITVVDEIKN